MTLTATFERATTTVSATLMTRAVSSLVVTARAEQMPRTWSPMGLLSKSGSKSAAFSAFAISAAPFLELLEVRTKSVVTEPEPYEV